jgi:hypothetical protein
VNARQRALLEYHRDIAEFATNARTPVFTILDLDDPVAFEIASTMMSNCAERRDAIKEGSAYPAFTLTMTIEQANMLLADGWPNAKPIDAVPEGMMAVMLVSEGRCVCGFVSKK